MSDEVFCEHANACAGCPLIELSYAEQLAVKQERVRAAITPYAVLGGVRIEPVLSAQPREAYRVRAKLMVSAQRDTDGALRPAVGLFSRSHATPDRPAEIADHTVIDIPRCRVLTPRLLEVASRVRQLLSAPPAAAGPCLVPEAMGGQLTAIDLREVAGEQAGVLLTLVVRSPPEPNAVELAAAAASARGISDDLLGLAVNYRRRGAPQILGATTRVLSGVEVARDRSGSAFHLATYGSFVQAHRAQTARMHGLIANHLMGLQKPSEMHLLDLYGGSGALSLPFAQQGAQITLVESFRPAAECAARAAALQGFKRFSVRAGDAARVLDDLLAERARFDAIIVNPPRRGMAPEVRKASAALKPRAMVYVSCDPQTLARDLAHLCRLGYRADTLHPIDMIPLTDQVETVAILLPAAPPPLSVLYQDVDVAIQEKPAYVTPCAPTPGARLWWSVADEASGFAVWCDLDEKAESRAATSSARPFRTNPEGRAVREVYVVLVRGNTASQGFAKKAHYVRLARVNGHSLLRVTVDPGSKSEFRRALGRMGHPIIGDRRFGHPPTNRHFEERYLLDRAFLHCVELAFGHPRTKAPTLVESDLPSELETVLQRLGHLRSMS